MLWRETLVEHRLRDVLDADGRPLGEVASARYVAAPTREVSCPYAGLRRGQTMNAAALAQVGSVWPAVLARLQRAGGEQATLGDVWRGLVGVLGDASRSNTPVGRELAATYKVSIGFLQVFTLLLLSADGLAERSMRSLGSGDSLLAVLEPSLVGSVQVCAGSPAQISAALTALGSGPLVAPASEHDEAATVVVAALLLGVITRRALLAGQAANSGEPRSLGLRWLDEHPAAWFRPVLSGPCPPVARVVALAPSRGRAELKSLAVALSAGTHRERGECFAAWLRSRHP